MAITHRAGRLRVANVDPHLSGVVEVDTRRVLGRVRDEEWNAAIQRHRVVKLVLEHVKIEQAVGIQAVAPTVNEVSIFKRGMGRKRIKEVKRNYG